MGNECRGTSETNSRLAGLNDKMDDGYMQKKQRQQGSNSDLRYATINQKHMIAGRKSRTNAKNQIDDRSYETSKALMRSSSMRNMELQYTEGQLANKRGTYQDRDFPPDDRAVIGNSTGADLQYLRNLKTQWKRPKEVFGPNYDVFTRQPDPSQIIQGVIGDCYLLSTLSAMAEWPQRIKDVFITKRKTQSGAYAVKICDMGIWKEIIVDDLIPTRRDQMNQLIPIGNTTTNNELWAIILEKAWAKIYHGYGDIEGGFMTECLHDLTGAPTKLLTTSDPQLWSTLMKGEMRNWIICASSSNKLGSDKNTSPGGIVQSHAYAILSVHEVQGNRLCRMRNPHGATEWRGEWSDFDKAKWTPQMQKYLEHDPRDTDDGDFFMPFKDMCKEFVNVQLCMYEDDHDYIGFKDKAMSGEQKCYQLKVQQNGFHYISVNQDNKRKYKNQPNYKYSNCHLLLAKRESNGYKYIGGYSGQNKEVSERFQLRPGKYTIFLTIDWYDKKPHDFSLGFYYPQGREVEFGPTQQDPNFLQRVFTEICSKKRKRQSYAQQGFKSTTKVKHFDKELGWMAYYYDNKKGRKTLVEQVTFLNAKGIKLMSPEQGTSYTVEVPPGKTEIVIIKLAYMGFGFKQQIKPMFR